MRITHWIVFGIFAVLGIGTNLLRLKGTIAGYRFPSKTPPQDESDKP
jgi:hypothetical protein